MSRRRHRPLLGFALVGYVVARGVPATAGLVDFSQDELRTLPRLCLAQRFINEQLDPPVVPESERTQVEESLGHSFIHYHHFCWALLYVQRAVKPDGDRFEYHRALDNLNYVIELADPTFVLLPDVYFEMGNVFARLGEREAAARAYQNALRARPDYTPASAALVQLYLDLGDFAAARTALAERLDHDPELENSSRDELRAHRAQE